MNARPLFALAALLMVTPLYADTRVSPFNACDAESEFDVTLHPNRLELTREDDGAPRRVELVDGRLWLDNLEQRLTDQDRARLRRFEAEVRALVPQIRDIAIQGVGIAADAISIVIAELGGDSARMDEVQRDLDRLSKEWAHRFRTTQTTRDWNMDDDGEVIGKMIASVVPAIASEIAAGAVRAALSGDQEKLAAIEARTERLEEELEARIEARGARLEVAAKALCPRILELDRIDNALAFRVDGKRRLDLIEVDRD